MGLLGVAAMCLAFLATLISVLVIGWFLILTGLLEITHAFTARRWRGFFLRLLVGIFHVVFGGVIIARPIVAADVFTLFIAFVLLFEGVLRLFYAFLPGQLNRLPLTVGGILSALMGIVILNRWPLDGLYVIGLFVGIELIIHASWLITMGLLVQELPEKLPDSREQPQLPNAGITKGETHPPHSV
jgi:uncharacterized membrane protein HdeD (DUF308 family)